MAISRDIILQCFHQFFALSNDAKLAYLPPRKGVTYLLDECGLKSDNPLLCFCYAANEFLDTYVGGRNDGAAQVIVDLRTFLMILIEQRSQYGYMWSIGPGHRVVSGPADRAWHLLQYLAVEVIRLRGWSQTVPGITFKEIVYEVLNISSAP